MKQFYLVEPKHNFKNSSRKKEFVEYDINTLIHSEAESILECNDNNINLSDEEFNVLVHKKADEIKTELMKNGIWKNEFGQPVFLYC